MLTFGELFAGVGGFSLGFEQAGWECRWQVEWDRHCQQVLARHWPEVARYGDVTDVDGAAIAPVTCITFGSPCQDLSVAGKRAGLDGARSGLFFEAIRIIREMRDATAGTLPRFAIWENVAGALSSNKGDDFLAVLDAFAEIGAVDIAWRLVDAQHFGVPQRRRRVFVVADFGGECAGAIHAEPAGMRWHPASGGTAGKDVAGGVACGLGADSRIAGPLGSNAVGGHRGDLDNAGAYVVQPFVKGKRASSPDDDESWRPDQVSPTLNAFDNGSESRATVTIPTGSTVRRLTPLECERLNGFPDHHTRWRVDGLEQSDSQRYRQMGNAVAVPCAAWLAWNLTISLQQEQQ